MMLAKWVLLLVAMLLVTEVRSSVTRRFFKPGSVRSGGGTKLSSVRAWRWRDLTKGEWMIALYKHSDSSSKEFQKAWEEFAYWCEDLNISAFEWDTTLYEPKETNSFILSLPLIYHVKDGSFRKYNGWYDKNDFIAFVEEEKWIAVQPTASFPFADKSLSAIVLLLLYNYLIVEMRLSWWIPFALLLGFSSVAGLYLGFIFGELIIEFLLVRPYQFVVRCLRKLLMKCQKAWRLLTEELETCDFDSYTVLVKADSLDCPVCLHRFTETPRVFFCGHSVCEPCTIRVFSDAVGRFECPVCRCEHKLLPPRNFALSHIFSVKELPLPNYDQLAVKQAVMRAIVQKQQWSIRQYRMLLFQMGAVFLVLFFAWAILTLSP